MLAILELQWKNESGKLCDQILMIWFKVEKVKNIIQILNKSTQNKVKNNKVV